MNVPGPLNFKPLDSSSEPDGAGRVIIENVWPEIDGGRTPVKRVMGEEVDWRSDLYSLGVVLYETLTGVRPFDGPSPAAVALERLRVDPRPITAIDPSLPDGLGRICGRRGLYGGNPVAAGRASGGGRAGRPQ